MLPPLGCLTPHLACIHQHLHFLYAHRSPVRSFRGRAGTVPAAPCASLALPSLSLHPLHPVCNLNFSLLHTAWGYSLCPGEESLCVHEHLSGGLVKAGAHLCCCARWACREELRVTGRSVAWCRSVEFRRSRSPCRYPRLVVVVTCGPNTAKPSLLAMMSCPLAFRDGPRHPAWRLSCITSSRALVGSTPCRASAGRQVQTLRPAFQ